MVEKHPFGNFVPKNTCYLFLGSFAGKPIEGYDWFFANGRNQFWPILREVYGLKLDTKAKQQELFRRLGMAITDIILACERKTGNNLDTNLTNLTINTKAILNICRKNRIKKIFFSSRFAETLFKRYFKDIIQQYPKIELVTLPSPSPRYALMSKEQKIKKYKELLPSL